jgi:hypothetical protein
LFGGAFQSFGIGLHWVNASLKGFDRTASSRRAAGYVLPAAMLKLTLSGVCRGISLSMLDYGLWGRLAFGELRPKRITPIFEEGVRL